MIRLTDGEFNEMVRYVKGQYGINLEKKRTLIEGRLANVLQEKGCKSYTDYINLLKRDQSGSEVTTLLNRVTTNYTYFMREAQHFKYMKEVFLPEQEKSNTAKTLNIWSAGCSMGAEVYTIAMTLHEYFGAKKGMWRTKLVATDISEAVLDKAKAGVYPADMIKDVPAMWRTQYFKTVDKDNVAVADKIRQEVAFSRLNLMSNFSFPQKFQLIFCRNVMIYFDQETRRGLVDRFYNVLAPGGYLFIGHSETITRETSKFKYIQPAIYKKVEN